MEFNFDIRRIFQSELTCLKSDMPIFRNGYASNVYTEIADVIDKMGEGSAKAQRLPQIVTNFRRFRNSNHKLFVLADLSENRILGILKSGRKHLFIHDKDGVCVETEPVCVLDFYVHESKQRQGCGRRLFDKMLQDECVSPRAIAIDSPSSKMLQFLRKHYGLNNPIFASNSYVIFPGFFEQQKTSGHIYRFNPTESQPIAISEQHSSTASSPNSSVSVEQTNYSIPHMRVQAMPTRMTVIKPNTNEENTDSQFVERTTSVPAPSPQSPRLPSSPSPPQPKSNEKPDIRPLSAKPERKIPEQCSKLHKPVNELPNV
ncbi:Alpha-tubulin N-acetyltransferase [Fasciolopsis buskii]|uniref:Alpha-tubulin N-acetyltransferase n=1 Tax=Fasciolopsis buskii TaxID=27845 RepID=A0A8E0VK63_9TREM|nr:Alpha-tubulin N-acetyltransferase [Fasciolopsis buski]